MGVAGFAVVALACVVVDHALATQLQRASVATGAALLAVLIGLTLLQARKRLPFLPLLKASTWLRCHIYAGLLSVVLFGLHLHGRLPRGGLEITLALLYLAVAASGLAGWGLSRWLPPRLTAGGDNVIYERIPALRAALRVEAENLVEQSVAVAQSPAIADFYSARLRDYFVRPRAISSGWLGARPASAGLLDEAGALDQFLDAKEREIMAQIKGLVQAKHQLDRQLAGQRLLKLWLFVHIPLTYALLVFAIVHGLLALTLG